MLIVPNRSISHRTVWSLAGPMIVSNLTVPIVGAVDTAVVGHLSGPHYIGAVALGALIFSFLYWGFGFLKMGVTGYIARAYGSQNEQEICDYLLRFIAISLIAGITVILLGKPLIDFALYILDSSERVELLASEYANIRLWSAPAALCVFVFTGVFVGLHNTRMALVLQLVLNLTNLVLDLLFVPVLNLGVPGVAWATLIAEYSAALLGFYLLRKQVMSAVRNLTFQEFFDPNILKHLGATNSNIFVRTVCLMFCFAFFTDQSARYGELILAANTILMHLQTFMAYGVDGFAHATEALGGSAYGSQKRKRFLRVVRLTTLWAFLTACAFSLIYLIGGPIIIGLFTNLAEIVELSKQFLPWMIVLPLFSFMSFQLDGLFIGVGYTRQMRNAMLISTAGYLLMAYIFQSWLGNHGLFLALICFMTLRAVTLLYYYPSVVRSFPLQTNGIRNG
ncbi:MAG: MATE family efflux transporter [Gammaproteobacteria bacterium]|nr:MATE family efflux transporter [Gammaproteobacteria bacterium]